MEAKYSIALSKPWYVFFAFFVRVFTTLGCVYYMFVLVITGNYLRFRLLWMQKGNIYVIICILDLNDTYFKTYVKIPKGQKVLGGQCICVVLIVLSPEVSFFEDDVHAHTNIHTHTYIYIYIWRGEVCWDTFLIIQYKCLSFFF
ncbi:unnamed protein product [Phytomonas sp. EM1]|nr:unnamed protein product [Phytomonas sp. EM1]|eukprot:CCW59963.1 unnamed protein product [Phytomonas sp. isolate EM1]